MPNSYFLFNVNYTSFDKIKWLVSKISQFKNFNVKTSVSNLWVPTAHWLLNDFASDVSWEVSWPPTNEKAKNVVIIKGIDQMRRFHIFRCVLRASVNHLRPGPSRTCWTDATASFANNDAVSTFLLILCFSQRTTEFYYSFRKDKFESARQLLNVFYHRRWSRLSLDRLMRVQRLRQLISFVH